MQAAFPGKLDDIDVEGMYRAVNKVAHPSVIRVEADEVTYNLHIFLRFELERELIAGRLRCATFRRLGTKRPESSWDLRPQATRSGVLQDVHWSAGLFGYFPTYTLGTVLSAQLYECVKRDVPDVEDRIALGDFRRDQILDATRIYRHGARFEPLELIERATGEPLAGALPSLHRGEVSGTLRHFITTVFPIMMLFCKQSPR